MEAMLKRWFGYFALILWLLLTVSGISPQLQIALFSGRVPLPSEAFKFALLGILLIAFFVFREQLAPVRLLYLWWAFVTYLLLHALYLLIFQQYSLYYVVYSYNPYYFFTFTLPLLFALRGAVTERFLLVCLMVLFLPLATLGIYQASWSTPLVATESLDGEFTVNVWMLTAEEIRGFSLFNSAFEFGHYIALVAGLAVGFVLSGRWTTKLVGLAFLILVAVAGYSTFTRAAYIEIAMTVFAAYLLLMFGRGRLAKPLRYLPIAYGLVAALIVFAAPLISVGLSSNNTLLSDRTMFLRYSEWSRVIDVVFGDDLLATFFGTGVIQGRINVEETYVIDNSFLAVWMQCGLVGLLLWLALMWGLWCYILRTTRTHNGCLTVAIAANWTTWMAAGMLNTAVDPYISLLMLLLLGLNKETKAALPIGQAVDGRRRAVAINMSSRTLSSRIRSRILHMGTGKSN
jgi:hypothetical protein